jgi:uncharacterized protein (TIGR02001 family)
MRSIIVAAALLAVVWAAPAAAQQAVGGGLSVSGGVGAATDYRFRGLSRSGGDPTVQADLTIDHSSGLYGGFFASTLGDEARRGDGELSLFAGYTREIATATNIDVGAVSYAYPGAQAFAGATDYAEAYASLSHTLGPVTGQVGAYYAPEQDALGGEDNLYLFADLSGAIPFTPIEATARVGRSDGGLAPGGDYTDWRIGLAARRGPARFGIDYVDTDLPEGFGGDATLVLSVRLSF